MADTASADVTTFDSGNSNRDSHAMEQINAIEYPTVDFKSDSVSDQGQSVLVMGKLTFHGTIHDLTVTGTKTVTDDKVTVAGAFNISMTYYNITRPALLGLTAEDMLRFTYNAAFKLK